MNQLLQDMDIFFRCVEDCNEPIMLTDRRGILVYVNPAWIRTYGYTRDEAIGQSPRLLRSQIQDDEFYQSMWKRILDPAHGSWRGELVNQAKDGRLVHVLLTITPHRSANGVVNGYMGIAVDLSEQKQMEMKILQQDRLASIGMLASGLAHEIGTPLGVIRGRAEILMMQLANNQPAQRGLEIIVRQIDRISKLIRSLLRVSRTHEEVRIDSVQVDHVLHEVIGLINQSCRDHHIDLKVEGPKGVGICADANQMQQVLLNLLINSIHAIEAAQKHGSAGPRRILIRITPAEETVSIAIHDTGCGIAVETMKNLFQPFFTTKDVGVGTGLGLAIVAKLVQEMKGKISVESPGIGHGATFVLTMPSCQL